MESADEKVMNNALLLFATLSRSHIDSDINKTNFDRVFIDEASIPYENIIVSNFDIDTRVYPKYFSCLTWHYLTTENPLRASYQPVPVYNNNIWEIKEMLRVWIS